MTNQRLSLSLLVVAVSVSAAVVVTAHEAVASPKINNLVQTADGPVEGFVNEQGTVQMFKGLPFAAPPVGDLRLKSPQPVTPWTTTRLALLNGPSCPQFRITDNLFLGQEDCLYLDVYIPVQAKLDAEARGELLPVMFWIFGGGWILGDQNEFGFYDAQNLANKYGVMVVSPNYRLAALGFLALDQLKQENPYNSTGGYALQDQTAALQWVQTNIGAFGGDPAKVTIFGESAGAFSVCWHLASPASAGLFRAALMESGSCDSPYFFRDYADAKDWSEQYVFKLGCDPISQNLPACLRALPTGKIMGHIFDEWTPEQRQAVIEGTLSSRKFGGDFVPALYPFMPWGAAIDGAETGLLQNPYQSIRSGNYHNVPVLFGTNHDEGTIFLPAMFLLVQGLTWPIDEYDLNRTLFHFFDNQTTVTSIINTYPINQYNDSWANAMNAIMRDDFFVCDTKRSLRALNENGQSDTWMYQWHYKGDWIEDPLLGNYHSGELEFVFGNEWPSPLIHPFSSTDRLMSDSFGTYWTNFAKFLTPNGNGTSSQPYWPYFDVATGAYNTMDVPPRASEHLYDEQCALWDRIAADSTAGRIRRWW